MNQLLIRPWLVIVILGCFSDLHASAVGFSTPLTGEEFVKKVAESKQQALLLYPDLRDPSIIRQHRDHFTFRLFELAYAAQELGERVAMTRIEKELGEPVSEPYKSRFEDLDKKIKARHTRHAKILALLRDKRCGLIVDGKTIAAGIPKRGRFGTAQFEILAPEHMRILMCQRNDSSHWVFKLNPENGEATLIPEASSEAPAGTIKFVIAN